MATPENRCPICGGEAEEHGANFECLYCGHKWRRANEFASESLRMATAYEKLRTSAFDEAEECFAGILASDAHNYEAHWGWALARHGIIFVDDLQDHIARVLAEMKGQVKLEKIRVDGGQISRKATKIAQESIRTREIGAAESTADLDEKQQIDLAYSYLQARDFARAEKQIDDVLFHDPACAEAYLCRILLNRRLGSLEDLARQIGQFADYDLPQAYLDRADIGGAPRILDLFYGAQTSMSDDTYAKVLQVILPYQYANRDSQIADNLEEAIEAGHAASFDLLLKTLDPSEVERYITLNQRNGDRLRKADRYAQAQTYYDRVLAVDEGNSDALRGTVYVKICLDEDPAAVTAVWERLLRYLPADKVGDEVQSMVKWMGGLRASSQRCGFGKNLLKYYPSEDMRPLTAPLLKMADSWLEDGYPAEAEYIVQLILTADKSCAGAWRALCLIRMGGEENGRHHNLPDAD